MQRVGEKKQVGRGQGAGGKEQGAIHQFTTRQPLTNNRSALRNHQSKIKWRAFEVQTRECSAIFISKRTLAALFLSVARQFELAQTLLINELKRPVELAIMPKLIRLSGCGAGIQLDLIRRAVFEKRLAAIGLPAFL